MPLLELHDLSVGYAGHPAALSAVSATLTAGTFCCLVGRNGTGKSTLLRTIARLQPACSGRIDAPSDIAIVLTQVPDLQHTTAREMAAYGRLAHTGILGRLRDSDRQAADRALRQVGIADLAERYISTLSDGEKQKVMIARALAQETQLLLLDEPSAFLDYPSRRDLMTVLSRLCHDDGKAILLSTHDVELATQAADILWYLHDGQLTVMPPQSFIPDDM